MQIEQIVAQVTIPQSGLKAVRQESAFDKTLESLEIGAGFSYVIGAKDKDGNPVAPTLKSQYARIAPSKWAAEDREVRKTFKVFVAPDQSGVEDLHTRFTVARVAFVEPVKRAKKAAAAPADAGAGEGAGADE